jgi:hypothetical protein|tara:strand:- start:2725 stop:2862 length:138 start_codon:yes stop_codon:yes gene_type:complete
MDKSYDLDELLSVLSNNNRLMVNLITANNELIKGFERHVEKFKSN